MISCPVFSLGMSCCHLSLVSCILSVSLFLPLLVILRRQGQFQADLKVITLSDPSEVSLCSIQHLFPSHTPCHPHSLSVHPLICLTLSFLISSLTSAPQSYLPVFMADIPAPHPPSFKSHPF